MNLPTYVNDALVILGGVSALSTALGLVIPGKVGQVFATVGLDIKKLLGLFGQPAAAKEAGK